MTIEDCVAIIAKLYYAAESDKHDPELYLDAAAWVEKLYLQIENREAIISNLRAEIGRLQAQAIY